MSDRTRAYLQIHLCVALWGFTAILGKLITLDALPLVWWRMLIVVGVLLLVPAVWRGLAALTPRTRAAYAGIGVLVGLHWLTFYGAIKLANASVAATCIALAPMFLALLEPLLQRRRPDPRDLGVAIAVVPGVALVVNGIPASMATGVAVGVLSALLVALFSTFNKRMVHQADPLTVTTLELGAGTVCLSLIALGLFMLYPELRAPWTTLPQGWDALWLLTLALACTLLPFTLSLVALRHLSAFSAQLVVNLEPLYAIALAAIVFREQQQLDAPFYLGACIVVASVFIHPWLHRERTGKNLDSLAVAEAKQIED